MSELEIYLLAAAILVIVILSLFFLEWLYDAIGLRLMRLMSFGRFPRSDPRLLDKVAMRLTGTVVFWAALVFLLSLFVNR